MKNEWMLSAHAHMDGMEWRATPQDWIVLHEGVAAFDGYHLGDAWVDPTELAPGQMINFDNRPAGQPNEGVEYITYVWHGVDPAQPLTLEAARAALVTQ